MLVNHPETERFMVKIPRSRGERILNMPRMTCLMWRPLTASRTKRKIANPFGVILVCLLFGSIALGQEQDSTRKQYSEKIASDYNYRFGKELPFRRVTLKCRVAALSARGFS